MYYYIYILYIYIYSDWRKQWSKWNVNMEQKNKRWNWSNCTKLAVTVIWAHGIIAQWLWVSEQNLVVVGSKTTQANFLKIFLKILHCWIPYVSVHSTTNVITCVRFSLKQMCWMATAMAEMKNEHWTKDENQVAVHSVRASERSSLVIGSKATLANFL